MILSLVEIYNLAKNTNLKTQDQIPELDSLEIEQLAEKAFFILRSVPLPLLNEQEQRYVREYAKLRHAKLLSRMFRQWLDGD